MEIVEIFGRHGWCFKQKGADLKICYLGNADYDAQLAIKRSYGSHDPRFVFNAVISRQDKVIAICTQRLQMEQTVAKNRNRHYHRPQHDGAVSRSG